MELQELYELMDKFEKSSLAALCYEEGDSKIELKKAAAYPTTAAVTALPNLSGAVQAAPAAQAAPAGSGEAESAEAEGTYIKAPLVGTFYCASAPGAEPYVKAGQKVKKGDVVCLIEAMKTINEIPAPFDCEIQEVIAGNETLVAYDAPLFRVKEL